VSIADVQTNLDLLDENQAAELLAIKPQTLTIWRSRGRYGLPFIRIGRCIRYRRIDLARWVESRRVVGAGPEPAHA
jgi:hypothetical protein